MERTSFEQMLQAGVHFGHLKRKWNPHMAPYIFTEKKGIHIIDLHKTGVKLDEAAAAMKQIAKSGKKILFVATKKQAKQNRKEHMFCENFQNKCGKLRKIMDGDNYREPPLHPVPFSPVHPVPSVQSRRPVR